MHTVTSTTVVATTARANDITLFASLELSKSKWVVTINGPGSEKFSKHVIEGGDAPAWSSFFRGRGRRPRSVLACGSKRWSFRRRDCRGFGFTAC
jgi:hypothetical protein